ncbi:MAG: hypothetical protein ACJ72S_12085, partial [Nitrososphaeraceae archaeon]
YKNIYRQRFRRGQKAALEMIGRIQSIFAISIFAISLFGCILCCIALALCPFSSVSAALDVLDSAVPYLSSNVPFPMSVFKKAFHFHDKYKSPPIPILIIH